jgi:hypothetical protein
MSALLVPENDIPMTNTPPPVLPTNGTPLADNAIREQLEWLTRSIEVLNRTRDQQHAEIDILRGELEDLRQENLVLKGRIFDAQPMGHSKASKFPDPPEFSGDKKELEAFLLACEMKIDAHLSDFPTEISKVLYAASFFRGVPRNWWRPQYRAYKESIEDITKEIPDELRTYNRFVKTIRSLFGDPNLGRTSARLLENMKQTRSVAEYIAEFESHRQHTDYNDFGLVRLFYNGLKSTVKDDLRHEKYNGIQELQKLALEVDTRNQERYLERQREIRTQQPETTSRMQNPTIRTPVVAPGTRTQTRPIPRNYADVTRPSPSLRDPLPAVPKMIQPNSFGPRSANPSTSKTLLSYPPPPSTPGGSMHLDSQRLVNVNGQWKLHPDEKARRAQAGLCLYCGKPGHDADSCLSVAKKNEGERQALMSIELSRPDSELDSAIVDSGNDDTQE